VVTPRARAHRPQQPQTFPYHFLLAEGVWGKPPERLKGNFGVAFAFQSSKSNSQSPFKKLGLCSPLSPD